MPEYGSVYQIPAMKRLTLPLFTALVLAIVGCYTNPVTGRKSLVLINPAQELSLGAQSFSEIRKTEKVSNDPAANARVRRIGERIAKAVGDQMPNAKWEFVVFESKDLNAFALPGGKVGVYTGLIKLAESDDELAIVMGHEIGHVVARHGSERMSEAMVIAGLGLVGTLVVDNNASPQTRNLFVLAYGGATTLGRVLPQSRKNESEADYMGLQFAAKAGYDPRAAIRFWEKMNAAEKSSKVPAWLSTHPAGPQRLADLKELAPRFVALYETSRNQQQPVDANQVIGK